MEGHLGEVYTAQLFPSGVVVLSGGSDLRIKIWSASTGNRIEWASDLISQPTLHALLNLKIEIFLLILSGKIRPHSLIDFDTVAHSDHRRMSSNTDWSHPTCH